MSIETAVARLLDRLSAETPMSPADLHPDEVSRNKGVYIWYGTDKSCPAYIGKATGKTGLRGRVMRQHLNTRYLEVRESVISARDQRQIEHGTTHNGRPAIEKSMFRKHLARLYDLAPGQGTVDFICANFEVFLFPLPDLTSDEIRKVEDELVQALKPRLNVVGNNSRNSAGM